MASRGHDAPAFDVKPYALLIGLLALALFVLPGCVRPGVARSPKIHADFPDLGELWLDGDATEPAAVEIERGETSLDIPAGTPVQIDAAGVVTFTAAEPVKLSGVRFAASVRGAKAFPPPAAPTPAEEADGRARWLGWIGLFVGVELVFVGLKGWPMVGTGGAGVAGASVAVLALSAVPRVVWAIGGGGLILAAFGWSLWHFWLRHRQPTTSVA